MSHRSFSLDRNFVQLIAVWRKPVSNCANDVTSADVSGADVYEALSSRVRGIVRGSLTVAGLVLLPLVSSGPAIGQSSTDNALNDVTDRCRPGAVPDYDNVRSLEEIFDVVERGVGGEIIKAELQQRSFVDACVWVYDVKVLTDGGDVKLVAYDASDLRLIGFSMPSSIDRGPTVNDDLGSGISAAPSTSSKTLSNPDADGVADSGESDTAAAAGSESDDSATDAASDAAADAGVSDGAQRDGKSDAAESSAASDSATDSGASNAENDAGGAGGNAAAGSGGTGSAGATTN